jgi:CubicO group peptidase (beta-lactamase class C family)
MTAQKLAPILLVLVASRLVASAAPAALPRAPVTSDPVDVLVRSVMTQLHVPGMAIAIVRDGTVDKLAGYGVANLETTDLMSKPLAFPVGTKAMYGNADFIVLARVLEIASGHRFEELLRTRLVEPLGLSCTSFEHATESDLTRTADVVPARASVYRWDHGQQRTA